MTRWILVVEDESPLGEMVCDRLEMEGYATELVRDGGAADERLRRGAFDLVLLDVMLPVRTGFDVLRELRGRGDRTPVLILSARSGQEDRIQGLQLQADDYLTKPFDIRELLLRVRALLRRIGQGGSEPSSLEFGGNHVDFRSLVARTWNGSEARLTATEARLLRLLSARDGAIVPRREIVDQLFGPASAPKTRTVDNLVLNLRKLLERDPGKPRHLLTVRGEGWRFVPAP